MTRFKGKVRGLFLLPFSLITLTLLLFACASIDCPVQNRVYTLYELHKYDGSPDTLTCDTLTISTRIADGSLDTLLNQETNLTYFELAISHTQPEDEFYVELADTLGNKFKDTIRVRKEDYPHFESVDCGATYFHRLTSVTNTKYIIDSVVIKNPNVNYDAQNEHFHIYFKTRY